MFGNKRKICIGTKEKYDKEQKKDRGYREARVETPSYTGGVSQEARRREDERRRRDDRGIVVESR